MQALPFSRRTYTGDGSTLDFAVPFPYLKRADVKVTVAKTAQVDGTDYNWTSDTEIRFVTAPAADAEVLVYRETPESDQIVQWKNGSYIVAEDLNQSDLQWLYLIQEHHDLLSWMTISVLPGVEGLITQNEAEKDPDDPEWEGDKKLGTVGAIQRIFANIVGKGTGYPGSGNKGKHGKIRIDHDQTIPNLFFWNGELSPPAWQQVATQGSTGAQGPKGDPPGLQDPAATASSVPNKGDGSAGDPTAAVTQDAAGDLKFDFGIPEGPAGPPGDAGSDGTAATVDVGSTTTGNAGTDASVTNSGTTSAAVLEFTIPRGATGATGPAPGLQNPAATASNVANKDASTLGDATATVVQDGDSKLQFQFGIPVGLRGEKGDTGAGVNYKGVRDFTDASQEPSGPINGDFYVNNKEGTGAWTGIAVPVEEGDRVIWDGANNQWDLLPNPSGTKVDLGYTAAADRGHVTNTGGTDATITVVTATNAGLMTPAQRTKLEGIDDGAEVNWAEPTDDGNLYARTRAAGSADGSWQQIPSSLITGVTGGSGISVTGTNDRKVEITYGQGVQASAVGDSGSLTIKLDGTTLSKSDNGLRVSATYNAPTADSAGQLTTTRTLWGQNFNGTANVTGSLTDVGNITGSGAIEVMSSANGNIELTPHGTGTIIGNSGASFGDDVIIRSANAIQLNNTANDRSVKHMAAGALATNVTYTWPAAPAANRILQSADTGVLTWIDPNSIGGFWTRDSGTSTLSPRTANDNLSIGGSGSLVVGGESQFNNHVNIRSGFELRLNNTANTFQVIHQALGTLASSATYTWPALPNANRLLQSDNSGTLSWVENEGNGTTEGGTTNNVKDLVFQENEMVCRSDYTLTANRSALSAGPITINDGVTITIPNNQNWVIL